jgi:hypothetical protein
MKIQSVRLGHATNSSSSHSIVIWKGDPQGDDLDSGWWGDSDWSWGWETFTAASPEAKAKYLAAQFVKAGRNAFPDDVLHAVVKDVTGIDVPFSFDKDEGWIQGIEIDHQSVFNSIPRSYGRNSPISTQFYREFIHAVMNRDDILILGGNDNDGIHPLFRDEDGRDRWDNDFKGNPDISEHPMHSIFRGYDSTGYDRIARKDPKYGYWTIFSPRRGTKVRLDLNSDEDITRASVPELVDMKITNWCDKNCGFCYQDSSHSGEHAHIGSIHNLLHLLGSLEVLEVALGGGEPVGHPEFTQILKTGYDMGLNMNFSTGTIDWLNSRDMVNAVESFCSAFAYSVTSIKDMENLIRKANITERYDRKHTRLFQKAQINIHIPMGLTNAGELKVILNRAYDLNIPVVLLGYKDQGRGLSYKPFINNYWDRDDHWEVYKEIALNAYSPFVSIDTALAQQWETRLAAVAVPESYDLTEGSFSCYIDALELTMAASSYDAGPAGAVDLNDEGAYRNNRDIRITSKEKILAAFSKIQDINLA